MIIAVLGILIGLGIGYLIPLSVTTSFSIYFSVAILAAIDSVFGALRTSREGTFDLLIFVSGFFTNAILAAFLAYIGDNLGVPIYYAAVFAFGVRLFNNLAIIRRDIITNYRRKRDKKNREKAVNLE